MTRVYVTPTPTPIADRLNDICGGLALSTLGKADSGGEWDPIRSVTPRLRRRLQGAGWLSASGDRPDVFADMLRTYAGNTCEPDPIGWYLREAIRALNETQAATRRDKLRRIAKRNGHTSYYNYRTEWCRQRGHRSLWHYRKQKGWE